MMIEQLEQQARLKELAEIDFTNEFELYFQPVIVNDNGQIEFLELLLRWQHPSKAYFQRVVLLMILELQGLLTHWLYLL